MPGGVFWEYAGPARHTPFILLENRPSILRTFPTIPQAKFRHFSLLQLPLFQATITNTFIRTVIDTNIMAEKLIAYYTEHPPNLDSAETILDMLWWNFTECNPIENEQCRSDFRAIRENLSRLDPNTIDEVFNLVCDLCTEKERLSFQGGMKLGVLLMRELQSE